MFLTKYMNISIFCPLAFDSTSLVLTWYFVLKNIKFKVDSSVFSGCMHCRCMATYVVLKRPITSRQGLLQCPPWLTIGWLQPIWSTHLCYFHWPKH